MIHGSWRNFSAGFVFVYCNTCLDIQGLIDLSIPLGFSRGHLFVLTCVYREASSDNSGQTQLSLCWIHAAWANCRLSTPQWPPGVLVHLPLARTVDLAQLCNSCNHAALWPPTLISKVSSVHLKYFAFFSALFFRYAVDNQMHDYARFWRLPELPDFELPQLFEMLTWSVCAVLMTDVLEVVSKGFRNWCTQYLPPIIRCFPSISSFVAKMFEFVTKSKQKFWMIDMITW